MNSTCLCGNLNVVHIFGMCSFPIHVKRGSSSMGPSPCTCKTGPFTEMHRKIICTGTTSPYQMVAVGFETMAHTFNCGFEKKTISWLPVSVFGLYAKFGKKITKSILYHQE